MMLTQHLKSVRSKGLLEGLGIKALLAFFSAKALRGGPRLLPQIAFCVVVLLILTRLVPINLSSIAFGSDYSKILKWTPKGGDEGEVSDGLRVVVFGGGDVATPNKSPEKAGGEDATWTEVLCQHLDCTTHTSFLPRSDKFGGALVSNSLYTAALERIAEITNGSTFAGEDYSWVPEQYPIPIHLPDLEQQVDTFLAIPPPLHPARETLWVFNFGYWEIWKLSTLPREFSKDVLEVAVRHIFDKIEQIYQASQSEKSIAYSDFYTFLKNTTMPVGNDSNLVLAEVPAESFRVFIPRLFDISLTPAFETVRHTPPYPHSRAEELRNAAYLTNEWNKMVDTMFDEWLSIPDPKLNATNGNETVGLEKRDAAGHTVFVPYARREALTNDVPGYLQEVIVDRQLRNAEVEDHNGLGTKPMDEGFGNVWQPCMPVVANHLQVTTEASCQTPQDHLFWTEFTVSQRAIDHIGEMAAEVFTKHVQADVPWLKKAQNKFPDLTHRKRAIEFDG